MRDRLINITFVSNAIILKKILDSLSTKKITVIANKSCVACPLLENYGGGGVLFQDKKNVLSKRNNFIVKQLNEFKERGSELKIFEIPIQPLTLFFS